MTIAGLWISASLVAGLVETRTCACRRGVRQAQTAVVVSISVSFGAHSVSDAYRGLGPLNLGAISVPLGTESVSAQGEVCGAGAVTRGTWMVSDVACRRNASDFGWDWMRSS